MAKMIGLWVLDCGFTNVGSLYLRIFALPCLSFSVALYSRFADILVCMHSRTIIYHLLSTMD